MWRRELKAAVWKPGAGNPRWAQVKRDGHRLSVIRTPSGRMRALTTTGDDIAAKLKPYGWWTALVRGLPSSSQVDGELFVHGEKASFVKSALKHEDSRLLFEVFGIARWSGGTADDESLEWAADMCRLYGIPFVEFADYEPDVDYMDIARGTHIEGFVLKEGNWSRWWKVKPTKTIDCVVTDFKPGRGKYLGWVGALHVSIGRQEIARVSGMDERTRFDIDENRDLGRVVEVEYQEVSSHGRLRHPRFVRWRDDKLPADCVLAQDPELEAYWNARS